ncbi:MAG TPA: ComEA family DNA-binding protein [Mycobacteriales bacterium]|nr:ComEA family DNA-binding protein [Mycobacteriales bacterium]
MRRRQQGTGDPVAVARVERLFAAPGGQARPSVGWVPPRLDDDAPAGPPAPAPAEVGEPESQPAADGGPEEEATSWAPRPRPAWADLTRLSTSASVVADEPPDAAGQEGRAPLLPDTLRGGRLDPGRTGAVALLLVCVLAAVVAAGVVLRGRPQEVAAPAIEFAGEPLPGVTAAPADDPTELVVSVAGDVVTPGVVRLPPGSRVDDAVQAAGGLAPGASYGLLNLARKLTDGEQVLVGIEAPAGAAAPGGAAAGGGLLDLNAATASDFETLPGIGPVLAERIVEWRAEHGPFQSVDQLREVPGIGEAKYGALKTKVSVA